VQIYCNGALSGDLGHDTDAGGHMVASGYSVPVTFPSGSGAGMGSGAGANVFWLVADVLFLPPPDAACAPAACIVEPLYANGSTKPLLSTKTQVESSFGPPYPPIPTSGAGAGGGAGGGSGAGGH
jgi:hypothetical protein